MCIVVSCLVCIVVVVLCVLLLVVLCVLYLSCVYCCSCLVCIVVVVLFVLLLVVLYLLLLVLLCGRPVHRLREDLCTGRPPTECDDTRCCIIQF